MTKKTKSSKQNKALNRSAKTGKFVTNQKLKKHPSTTEREHYKTAR